MSKMRVCRIMIEHHDPCHVCIFQEQCTNYGGCMGWTPDDADKSEIVTLREKIKELETQLNPTKHNQ